jgi:hypothetical protein
LRRATCISRPQNRILSVSYYFAVLRYMGSIEKQKLSYKALFRNSAGRFTIKYIAETLMLPFKFAEMLCTYISILSTVILLTGVALNNSPVGLAAYMIEKYFTWTNMAYRHRYDGGMTKMTFGLSDMLDQVMLYWATGSITSSMRLYAEAFNKKYTAENWDA